MNALESTAETITHWPVENASAIIGHGNTVLSTVGNIHHSFALASVSKPLVAYSVMIAYEEGAFELTDTLDSLTQLAQATEPHVAQALERIPGPKHATVKDFLAHTSGVGFNDFDQHYPVNTRRLYSSASYVILAEIITATTGIPFADYIEQALFTPLGMKNTFHQGNPGHGITSTTHDLLAFIQELNAPQLLSQSTVDLMLSVYQPELDGIVPGYGMQKPCPWTMGMEMHGQKNPHWLARNMPPEVIGHFGQSGTFLWYTPHSQKFAIVLTDKPFGTWCSSLWPQFNSALWDSF